GARGAARAGCSGDGPCGRAPASGRREGRSGLAGEPAVGIRAGDRGGPARGRLRGPRGDAGPRARADWWGDGLPRARRPWAPAHLDRARGRSPDRSWPAAPRNAAGSVRRHEGRLERGRGPAGRRHRGARGRRRVMQVADGLVVVLEYTVHLADGTLLDSTGE